IVDSNAATEVEAHHIDPVVLAAYCDATLIVCTQQSFSKEVLEDLKATFQAQNLTGKVIGLLHNAGAQ
ncbi:MAG: hypothetical protein KDD62_08650, partial [Bdellovibrionales bacterium]|nr:hypothetical protein [Bdellovibrionales bacterium]